MFEKLRNYINPIAHLGEKKYSFVFPAVVMISVYMLFEIIFFITFKKLADTGSFYVIGTLFLVSYFSFRNGIKGGLTSTVIAAVFYIYFILGRPASFAVKETAAIIAGALTILHLFIALSLGWLRQTVDTLLADEQLARIHAEDLEQKFRTLADNIPNLCWVANPKGYIYWYNKRWYEYTGSTKKQSLGWGWKAFHDPKKLREVLKLWNASITTGQPFEMIFPIKGADGTYRQFLTRIIPMKNYAGKITNWIGTNTDITEQKQIEQQKDDFIAMVSHELKTPLTSVKIYAQTARKEYDDNPKAVILMDKLNEQVDKLRLLINTILDSVRIEHGKAIEEKPFILGETALSTIATIQDTTDHKLSVDWQTSEYLIGNREKIEQVLTNLITNAIKYSPKKSQVIIRSQKKNKSIVISVQDFGIGLSKDEQKHIFERFYQSGDNRTYPGLGLGLYISSEIINQHGGKMWVKSEKGEGSTFYFSLPIYNGKRVTAKKSIVSKKRTVSSTKKRSVSSVSV